MVTREEIIDEIIKQGLVETCVKYQTIRCNDQYLKEELIQNIWVILLEAPLEVLEDAYLNRHLNAYITGIVTRQWFSSRSAFHYTYRKKDRITDEITKEVLQIPDEASEL